MHAMLLLTLGWRPAGSKLGASLPSLSHSWAYKELNLGSSTALSNTYNKGNKLLSNQNNIGSLSAINLAKKIDIN